MVAVRCVVKVKFQELKANKKNSDIYKKDGLYNIILWLPLALYYYFNIGNYLKKIRNVQKSKKHSRMKLNVRKSKGYSKIKLII